MSDVAKNMDSVFANAADDEVEFETMFDQEDSLIDTVNGVNEAGDPLTGVDFEDLHQTQDDATADDVRDGEADDEPMGAKDPEGTEEVKPDDGSVEGEVGKESDADKFHGDAEKEYQDGKGVEAKTEPDVEDIESVIDKVAEGAEEGTGDQDIDDVMMADDDDPVDEKCAKEGAETCPNCGKVASKCTCSKEGVKECQEGDEESKGKLDDNTNPEVPEKPEAPKDTTTDAEEVKEGAEEGCTGCDSVDSLEAEIAKEAEASKTAPVGEASDPVDSDVAKVDDADSDDDDAIIDQAIGKEEAEDAAEKLAYEPSDEDLIDMAINGDLDEE